MKIGILKTDTVRPEWVPNYGEYPDMFERLMSGVDSTLEFRTWDVEQGELPERTDLVDGYIITGSKSSAYDDKPWIRNLEVLIRQLYEEGRRVVGICFGHQVIAQALGGIVEKSPKGWGVGVNVYDVVDPELRADTDQGRVQLLASHQDQVVSLPAGAEVIASNEHCAIAGFKIGECILTFQPHPEFVPGFSKEIMEFRREQIGETRAAEGMASLESYDHQGDRVARWMLNFLKG